MKIIRIHSTVVIDIDAFIESTGVDRGSVVNIFHDFDVDDNEYKYLIEIKDE